MESRRAFLRSAAVGGAAIGLGDIAFLRRMGPVSAEDAALDPSIVRFDSSIEPIVRLLEDTPRERLLEEVASRIHRGLTYREVLAALLLAGVRNVQPRPQVGFKFHAVLVVNSAHLASISSPVTDRWLPIFWALDYFKDSQARDVREGNWTMSRVNESKLPSRDQARKAFIHAMDNWDEEAADAAVAGLARSEPAKEIFKLFCRYGARDFRSIGHKAIFVANSWRTLECIGWQHAEPILRSLAYALLSHEGDNPASGDADPDRPFKFNNELAGKLRSSWKEGKSTKAASKEMLDVLRNANVEDCCTNIVKRINNGASPSDIWDALYAGAGELMMRKPGIVALHAVTTTNAMSYAFRTVEDDMAQRLLLLQNAAFLCLFRDDIGRSNPGDVRIDTFAPADLSATGSGAITEIFADISRNRMSAAKKTLSYLQSNGSAKDLIDAARVLVFLKGDDAHDYKFSSAVLEDYNHVSSELRDRYLAASMFSLQGSGFPDNSLVQRTRVAVNGN